MATFDCIRRNKQIIQSNKGDQVIAIQRNEDKDVVEFRCDLARVGAVCSDVRCLVNGRHENVSESMNM